MKTFTAFLCFVVFFHFGFNSSTAIAQQDSLNPVKLNQVELHRVKPSKELPFAGTHISKKDIVNSSGNGSINNMFENMPATVVSSESGTGLGNSTMRIRGIDHTRINVTINGIELNDAESQGTWFVNMPNFTAYIQSFDIQRGVGSSTNGAATFGASINFNSLEEQNKNSFFEISSAAGSFSTFKNTIIASSGLVKNRFIITASYSNIQSKGYIDRAFANLNSAFASAQYNILGVKSNKNYGTLKFNAIYGKERTGLAWNGTSAEMLKQNRTYNSCGAYIDDFGRLNYYDNETDNYRQNHYQLFYHYQHFVSKERHLHNFDSNIGLHLTRGIGYYQQYKKNKKYSVYNLSEIIIDSIGKELKSDLISQKYLDNYFYGFTFNLSDNIKKVDKNSTIKWIVGGAFNRYDGDHYGYVIWTKRDGYLTKPHQWYNNNGTKTQTNIYGKIEYSPAWRMLLYGDIQYRYIHYNITGIDDNNRDITAIYEWKNFVNPKVGVNIFLDSKKSNSLYLSFAISNREPARSDIVDAPAGRTPVAEQLFDTEFGYLLSLKKIAFNANSYFMYYNNQLVLTGELNDVGDAMMTNVNKSYRAGLELTTSYRPASYFLWKINGTFSLNKIVDFNNYVIDYDTEKYLIEHIKMTNTAFSPAIVISNEFVITPFKNFDIYWGNKFVSKQYLDNTSNNDYILNPYIIGSLQLNYEFNIRNIAKISLFFLINNLYNYEYSSNGALYQYLSEGKRYYEDYYNPQAGINFIGGVTIRF